MWLERLVVPLLNALSRRPKAKVPQGITLGSRVGSFEATGPVVWPDGRLCEHAVVVGKTGVGKTHFLLHLACEHMRAGRGLFFLDFHGDAAAQLTALAASHEGARERLVLVNPTDATRSPGLNPLEVGGESDREAFARTSELTSILRQRWGVDSFGARTEELLRCALYTLASNRLTLAEAPMLLTRREFRAGLAARLPNADVREYWLERFEPLSDAQKAQFREPLLNKITAFLTDPMVRQFLGQQQSTVDLGRAMDQGQWVVVNLAKGVLREHAHTLGNLIFARLQFDVLARSRVRPQARRTFAVICDEVQNLKENDLSTLLTEGRKFGVSLVTATQAWEGLPLALRAAMLTAGTHVFFRVSSADAGSLAPEISSDERKRYVSELTSLSRGEAIVRIGADPPARITVPRLPSLDPASRREAALISSLSRTRYARDREEVERGIRARQRVGAIAVNPPPHEQQHPDEGQHGW